MPGRLLPLLVAALAACGGRGEAPPAPAEGHHHEARYGGTLVPLGDHEAQVEILLDGEAGKLTAYLWDGCAENPVRSHLAALRVRARLGGAEVELSLLPVEDPLTGEKKGDTARFEASSEKLRGIEDLEGSIVDLSLGGKTYTVPFDLGSHGEAHE